MSSLIVAVEIADPSKSLTVPDMVDVCACANAAVQMKMSSKVSRFTYINFRRNYTLFRISPNKDKISSHQEGCPMIQVHIHDPDDPG